MAKKEFFPVGPTQGNPQPIGADDLLYLAPVFSHLYRTRLFKTHTCCYLALPPNVFYLLYPNLFFLKIGS